MKTLPAGRGFWIWHLSGCEGGQIAAIIAKAQKCGVTWLAIKAGDQGNPWSQFTPALVQALHAAGLKVYGWSYDVPGKVSVQTAVVKRVADCGADGFIIDAEIEWERPSADKDAAAYISSLNGLSLPANFVLAHAPFDVISGHAAFPYTAFGSGVSFVSPQAYWPEHGMSEAASTARMLAQWQKYATQKPQAARPLLPSGYSVQPDLPGGKMPTAADMLAFEAHCKAAGCAGVLYWRWDGTPDAIWQGLAGTSFPV
uniref:Uncharacterized protein n=1 Tax=uncultured Caudovirales phage TaxID=2100421 RepID=A0A6J5L5X0_9CAUD|nr:hypothetical protein UFOVP114_37 [uncultured Caudovirales phage]